MIYMQSYSRFSFLCGEHLLSEFILAITCIFVMPKYVNSSFFMNAMHNIYQEMTAIWRSIDIFPYLDEMPPLWEVYVSLSDSSYCILLFLFFVYEVIIHTRIPFHQKEIIIAFLFLVKPC